MKFRVPYNYLPEQFSNREDIFTKWKELAKSGEFTLGPYVINFENRLANYLETEYCISTNSGTDALIIALKAVGIKAGDEVITVPNSFYATTGAIVACGATPVFVDVDDRMQIDIEKIREKVTSNTKAVVPVYWAGAGPDMAALVEVAERYGLKIVSDACMAIGGKYSGKSPANWGDIVAYSMHPLKSLNVMGDGGAITTNRAEYAEWILKYRNHGMVNRNEIEFYGINSRMQPLQAVVANLELEILDEVIKKRNGFAEFYDNKFSDLHPNVKVLSRKTDDIETYCLYMLFVERRNELLAYLNEVGIEAKIHYPTPLHRQQATFKLNTNVESLPIAEDQAKKIITIPCHQYLNDEQTELVVKAITEFYS